MSTFSVIIPVYNAEAFLERAVRSVQTQTQPPLEILMVDDCSTDNTREVVKRLAAEDPRIRLLQTPQNGGPSAARNLGIANATGEWIAILDADDAFAPTRLEKLGAIASRRGDIDMLADDLLYFDADANCVSGRANATAGLSGHVVTLDDFLRHNQVDGSGMDWGLLKPCFRRAFLEKTGLRYRADMRHGEDFALVVSLLLAGAMFVLLDEALYLYTQRSGAVSGRLSALSRTSIAYGALARSALELAQQPKIASQPELVRLLQHRAEGLMRLDDAHFFSVAVRKGDVIGLGRRALKRPSFLPQVASQVSRAVKRRLARH
ncbi:glycosyltransferase [Acetobacter estunensis]|uniref:glycosyltransferase family 2 protein n=1 Tax=Acetobacter estunensis TaxID=104097 RepID=UPI001C2DBF0D|nr:glycosyltransferase [Acetobacter estunensis]MBV1837481.1 glycosyltransferase [Acetobacter estunensis]